MSARCEVCHGEGRTGCKRDGNECQSSTCSLCDACGGVGWLPVWQSTFGKIVIAVFAPQREPEPMEFDGRAWRNPRSITREKILAEWAASLIARAEKAEADRIALAERHVIAERELHQAIAKAKARADKAETLAKAERKYRIAHHKVTVDGNDESTTKAAQARYDAAVVAWNEARKELIAAGGEP